jgi:hypothetical protein
MLKITGEYLKSLLSLRLIVLAPIFLFFISCVDVIKAPTINRKMANASFQHKSVDTTNCSSCHKDHRPQSKTPSAVKSDIYQHGKGRDCSQCHVFETPKKWLDIKNMDHSDKNITSCAKCHDYKRPPLPHPAGKDCISCHTFNVWKNVAKFDHPKDLQSCNACHDDGSNSSALNKRGRPVAPHPQGGRDCVDCHSSSKWTPLKAAFDHSPKPASCVECHTGSKATTPKRGRPTQASHPKAGKCIDCHTFSDWKKVIKIDHTDPKITSCNDCHSSVRPVAPHPSGGDCITCHQFPAWRSLKQYDHNPMPVSCNGCHDGQNPVSIKERGRPPEPHPQGARECKECHVHPAWKPVVAFDHLPEPKSCEICHSDNNTTAPKLGRPTTETHPKVGDCKGCHTYNNWNDVNVANYNHDPAPASCLGCHDKQPNTNATYRGIPVEPHPASGDCITCHTIASWLPATFNHDPKPTSCNQCHEGKLPSALTQKGRPLAPHPAGPRDCIDCHDYPAWKPPTKFDHNPTPTSCNECHENKSPLALKQKGRPVLPHPQTRDCNECHTYNDWVTPVTFDHNPAPASCNECHAGRSSQDLVKKGPPVLPHPQGRDCVDCHTFNDWKVTKPFDHDPAPVSCQECHVPSLETTKKGRPDLPHVATGDCVGCHSFNDWTSISNFDHNPITTLSCLNCHGGQPVTATTQKGRPIAPHPSAGDCIDCHSYPGWKNVAQWSHDPKPATCNECHNDNSASAVTNKGRPAAPHPGSNRDCVDCHNYPAWKPPTQFDHNPTPTSCNQCHDGQLSTATKQKGRPIAPHPANGRDCIDCHSYPDWKPPVSFDHNPKPVSCNSCHDGQPANATKQKGRPTSSLTHPIGSRDCVDCHNTGNWKPVASFDHNPLPGNCVECHTGTNATLPKLGRPVRSSHTQTGKCSTCHTYPLWSDVSNFDHTGATTCVSCHEVKRPATPHPAAGDCASCHANPSWVPSTKPFDHAGVTSCTSCHETTRRNDRPNLVYHPAAGDCNQCHQPGGWTPVTNYPHTNPVPTSCQNCHTGADTGTGQKRGRPGGSHTQSGDCNQCHEYSSWTPAKNYSHDPKPNECGSCHEGDRSTTKRWSYPNSGDMPTGNTNNWGTGHYKGQDCLNCHETPLNNGGNNWGFDEEDHTKPRLKYCLPCHYETGPDKNGFKEHGTSSRFSYKDGGNCKNCHGGAQNF